MAARVPPFLSDPCPGELEHLGHLNGSSRKRDVNSDGVALQQANSHYYSPARGKAVLSSGTTGPARPTVESPAVQGVTHLNKCYLRIKGKKRDVVTPHFTGTSTPPADNWGGFFAGEINGYHWLQPNHRLLVPSNTSATPRAQDTHPLHQRTGLCHHTPPSLPATPSSSAAGSATPAPRGCGTARGASAGGRRLGRSDGPFPKGTRKRPTGDTSSLETCSGTFASLHVLLFTV